MRREMEEHNDFVFLPVTEGYRMNSRKVRDCIFSDAGTGMTGMTGMIYGS